MDTLSFPADQLFPETSYKYSGHRLISPLWAPPAFFGLIKRLGLLSGGLLTEVNCTCSPDCQSFLRTLYRGLEFASDGSSAAEEGPRDACLRAEIGREHPA